MSLATPTPLRTEETGLISQPNQTGSAVATMVAECRAWGAIGLDLEWAPDGRITWIGIGTAYRAISVWRPWLPQEAMEVLKAAMADATLPKIIHNCQADIQVWEREEGPVCGFVHDTMLAHHAAYPGLAHDLQNVVSQFIVVPPWKFWHRSEQAQAKEREKVFKKEQKVALKEAAKVQKAAERATKAEDKLRQKAIDKLEKFVAQIGGTTPVLEAALQALQTASGEDLNFRIDQLVNVAIPAERDRLKAEKKAARMAAHEQMNAERAAEKQARRGRKPKGAAPAAEAVNLSLPHTSEPVQDAPAPAPVPAPSPVVAAPEPEEPRLPPRAATYNPPNTPHTTADLASFFRRRKP